MQITICFWPTDSYLQRYTISPIHQIFQVLHIDIDGEMRDPPDP